jgi:hypothetical protein
MYDCLLVDYQAMSGMNFGEAPSFAVREIETLSEGDELVELAAVWRRRKVIMSGCPDRPSIFKINPHHLIPGPHT